MNKQELIKHIEDLPYKEGPIVNKIDISRKRLSELVNQLDEPEKTSSTAGCIGLVSDKQK